MAKTVIVIGPKKTIEIDDNCINALGRPAYSLTVEGVKTAISDVGFDYLINTAKEAGFAVFKGV